MPEPLKLLIVDDSEADAHLIVEALAAGGFTPDWRRVETAEAMTAALAEEMPDIVLCDRPMPSFGPRRALRLLAELGVELPFVVVPGVLGDELAAETMRLGARDVVLKDNMSRLAGVVAREISDARARRLAELALAEQNARLQGILAHVVNGIVTIDETGVIESFNPAAERLFGYAAAEVLGTKVNRLMGETHAERHDGYLERYLTTGKGRMIGVGPRELPGRHKSGELFPMELSVSEMWLGHRRVFIGVTVDIRERKSIERQLQQAQKMEAVGNLTGGVAHDFNNILSVVLGNVQLLARRLQDDPARQRELTLVDRAERATLRGAELTSRLLAFSRRQVMETRVVDVNRLTLGMDDLLRRTLGEDVEVETVLGGGLWLTRTDSAQLESAILNLAVNARDAMPSGGKLTIETANVRLDDNYVRRHPYARAGRYVMLAVTDTGVGIEANDLERVFEPFFTTKGVGKGTGLGLSMVYGFAKQSGGHTGIYSEPGVGTTVRLYLPKADAKAASDDDEADDRPFPTGDETVLVVEDDAALRETTSELLADLGYKVLRAEDGPSARALLESGAAVDVMLTDMVMPGGMNGADLARLARERYPGMAVVLTSGYAHNGVTHQGVVSDDMEWIGKPYDLGSLARKIRAALDR